jgi:uncharacterized protein YcbK (DUF882 family)
MISMDELLSGNKLEDQPQETQDNLKDLLEKMNKVRVAYGKPMTVSSGLRSIKHHLEIYAAKGITDKSKIPMKSKHLYGLAVDIADTDGKLKEWVKANIELMEEIGFWFESFDATTTWVHFQNKPFGSYKAGGTRWFNP